MMSYAPSSEPYPGLRPFYREEVNIFFGRDDNVNDMVEKLAENHFVCITGPSGCGKSSLAKTGLMNALEAGFLPGVGSDWLFADMRPGSDPLNSLVSSLATMIIEDSEHALDQNELELMFKRHLDTRSYDLNTVTGLLEGVSERPILLLIDQFEELFRFTQKDKHLAATFVEILLKTFHSRKNIYVILTIRTEELENCSRYPGLTSAINSSQFLTPTLDRFQIQEAIEGPITVFGGKIEPNFTIWLLNNVDPFLDKLPILQHTLKLLYTRKKREQVSDVKTSEEGITLSLDDFHQAFGTSALDIRNREANSSLLKISLSAELNRIYNELELPLQRGAKRLFCELTDINVKGRDIRRPRTAKQIADSIGLPVAGAWKIIRHFIEQDVGYLYVRQDEHSPDNSIVDVSHECVLRLWNKLQGEWLVEEQKRADDIRMLASFAKNHENARAQSPLLTKLRGSGLLDRYTHEHYSSWFKEENPTIEWAGRYLDGVHWETINSEFGAKTENEIKFLSIQNLLSRSWWRQTITAGIVFSSILIPILVVFASVRNNAFEAKDRADEAEKDKQEIERLYSDAVFKVGAELIDNVEKNSSEGMSLYTANAQGSVSSRADCNGQRTFCGRLKVHSKAAFEPAVLKKLTQTPFCSDTQFTTQITQLGSKIRPICSFYPPKQRLVPDLSGGASKEKLAISNSNRRALKFSTKGNKQKVRAIFFGLASKYPTDTRFFFDLSQGYLLDEEIAAQRRFSEASACISRSLDLICNPLYEARALYFAMAKYEETALTNISTGVEMVTLNQDITALKIMMSAEFLDDATMMPATDVTNTTEERVSRLWRGFDGASDGARALYHQYECATRRESVPQCIVATNLYKKAVRALALILTYSKRISSATENKLQKQIAYGMGLASLHWAQDSSFRTIAEKSISQDDMISELEKAYLVTGSRRYPSALSMLYCLAGKFEKATSHANSIRSDRAKYTEIKELALSCNTAKNIKTYFDKPTPSE